ncbi:hypothetical protein CGC21_28245 [Leishmania donovani]|uniref:Uncharacterized protein n=1 Tax=Leishmania donovani TaxID=5661 RepID=A0A504XW76_LEIDO|nr:hypothetical protein CGC21_28245 [Leishmania donovani]
MAAYYAARFTHAAPHPPNVASAQRPHTAPVILGGGLVGSGAFTAAHLCRFHRKNVQAMPLSHVLVTPRAASRQFFLQSRRPSHRGGTSPMQHLRESDLSFVPIDSDLQPACRLNHRPCCLLHGSTPAPNTAEGIGPSGMAITERAQSATQVRQLQRSIMSAALSAAPPSSDTIAGLCGAGTPVGSRTQQFPQRHGAAVVVGRPLREARQQASPQMKCHLQLLAVQADDQATRVAQTAGGVCQAAQSHFQQQACEASVRSAFDATTRMSRRTLFPPCSDALRACHASNTEEGNAEEHPRILLRGCVDRRWSSSETATSMSSQTRRHSPHASIRLVSR